LQCSQEDNAAKAALISQVRLPALFVPRQCHVTCGLTRAQLQSTIAARDAVIKDLEEQARADAMERRKLHNMVQELKGNPISLDDCVVVIAHI
jgi:hypothetical protein